MSYETLIFYSVVTSVISLDRVDLKKKVVDAPEILTVIDSIPNLTSFLNSLYNCQYGSFFKARDAALDIVKLTWYHRHPSATHPGLLLALLSCNPSVCLQR